MIAVFCFQVAADFFALILFAKITLNDFVSITRQLVSQNFIHEQLYVNYHSGLSW